MYKISNKCHKGLVKTLVKMLPLIPEGDNVKDAELRRKVQLLIRELNRKTPLPDST